MELPVGANFTQLRNVLLGGISNTFNGSEVIELVAAYEDQVLQPHLGNVVQFQVVVNATTQACALSCSMCCLCQAQRPLAHAAGLPPATEAIAYACLTARLGGHELGPNLHCTAEPACQLLVAGHVHWSRPAILSSADVYESMQELAPSLNCTAEPACQLHVHGSRPGTLCMCPSAHACAELSRAGAVQAFTPQAVFLNNEPCDLTLNVEINDHTPAIAQDTSQLIESGESPITIQGTDLYGVDGNKLQLKGINWFGFETPVSCLA